MKKTILAVAILVVAAGGWLAWEFWLGEEEGGTTVEQSADGTLLVTADEPAAACEGTYFDSHAHLDEYDNGPLLAKQMAEHAVGCAVLFVNINPDDPEDSLEQLVESIGDAPGRFVPFVHINPQTEAEQNAERLATALDATDIPFTGIGEVAFYREPFQQAHLTTPAWDEIFELAAERGLFVMIHLRGDQGDELRTMLEKHPTTKVLIHSRELYTELPALLTEHDNLFYTLDTTNLLNDPGESTSNTAPIFFPPRSNSADEFIVAFDSGREKMLENTINMWPSIINSAPDRVFWGTDVAFDWHTDPEVYRRLIEFTADFVAALPTEHRAGYTHENAERLFGNSTVTIR